MRALLTTYFKDVIMKQIITGEDVFHYLIIKFRFAHWIVDHVPSVEAGFGSSNSNTAPAWAVPVLIITDRYK